MITSSTINHDIMCLKSFSPTKLLLWQWPGYITGCADKVPLCVASILTCCDIQHPFKRKKAFWWETAVIDNYFKASACVA